ncbi:MAG: LacI family DNA-binding transcriptional regulator [Elusimicrobiota bacterium]
MNLTDISRKLHISRRTISRALYNEGYIDRAKKDRIIRYLNRINYRPRVRGSIRAGKGASLIALVMPSNVFNTIDFMLVEVIKTLNSVLIKNGYNILLLDEYEFDYQRLIDMRNSKLIAGAVISSPVRIVPAALDKLKKGKLPVVMVFSRNDDFDSFAVDNARGGYMAAKYLIDKGKKTIAFLHGRPDWPDAADRFMGFRKALDEAGIKVYSDLIKDAYFDYNKARDVVRVLISQKRIPDAIFAANDKMAMGAIAAIKEKGLDIPGNIAVIGYDNIPEANFTSPPLSTIAMPMRDVVEKAAKRLLVKLENRNTGNESPMMYGSIPELVLRESA